MAVTPDTQTRLSNSVDAQLDRMPVGRVHRKVIVAIGLGLFFDIYEVFLSGSISTALGVQFKITGTTLSLLLASAFIGMFVGASVLGGLADRFGRRKAFLFNLIWYSAWSLIAAFSPTAWFLIVARFLAGVGVGAEYPVADAYLSDVLPKDKRGRLASWAYTCSFIAVPIVGFLALWLNSANPGGIPGWRYMLGLGGVGALVVLFLRRGLPESPRWLARVGRNDEAVAALRVFADGAGVAVEPVTGGEGQDPAPQTTRAPRLTQQPYAKRMVMLVVFHLFQGWGYYGFGTLSSLVLVANGQSVTQSLLYTAISFLGYPVGSVLAVPLMRYERKYLLIGSILAMALFGILFATSSLPVLIVVFGFLTTAISNVFSNVYHVYQAEIFPTTLRATAVGRTYSLSRLSSAALPFILLPVLTAFGAPVMFSLVAFVLLIITGFVIGIGPKTSYRSVVEINPE
ncbi:MFS transporter [Frondihabitans australicus]|uniref:Sugar transport protein n=1 Tax=Frondihabitans australicus TaxID=386892 RepID=A0A495IH88_9MICO|nr:MFS transporter [Frondihabitans australicus]RKR75060.1 sugar transport protein [Frondihabitans australicus]